MDLLFRQFLAHALARPEQAALSGPGGALTYGELANRAHHVAAGLRAAGVRHGDRVGLCLDWTPDLLAAVIGAWQAGAAYVPLDPSLPRARLAAIVEQARPVALVAASHWQAALPREAAPAYTPAELEALCDRRLIDDTITPADLAYVMFTSGTSGPPKGVCVSHGNLAGLFAPFAERFHLHRDDAWSLCHSYGFGYSIWETWGGLSTGARLVPVPAAWRADPVQLQTLLAEQAVTILSQTPSAFRQTVLHEAFNLAELEGLRLVALSGEAVPVADVERWFQRLGEHDARLINTYAVTETGGQVTCRVYAAAEGVEHEPDSVGRPLPGIEIRLLDAKGREAADGETGELYVAGPGIAQGYLDDIELTQSRFVHLNAGDESTRFYRTGDLARRTARGELVFAGRADDQLKWHGYRIETSEIESVVQAHPAVREAAVAVRGPADNARLVGYYVTGEPASGENATELWPAVGPYQVYDEFLYDLMSTDDVRVERFRQAYARHAKGRVVLDIGTGENALLARLCIDAGARHVYAVEVLAEAAARARETVEALGLQDRITVIEGDMAVVDLPESVDLVTQGLVGNIGSADGIIPIWNAARRHFGRDMVPVPSRCRTRIALAELPDSLEQSPAFTPVARRYAQRVFDERGGTFDIRLCVRNFPSDGLLSQGAVFEDLDFAGQLEPLTRGTARLRAQRRGRVDGLLLWTEVDAGGGEAVDYLENQQAWLPVFLPLPDGGVNLEAGAVADLHWRRDDAAGLCPDYHLELHLESAAHTIISRHQESDVGTTRLHRQLHAAPERTAVGPERLREWVAEHLPGYMVPGAWVHLPALPLNTNGKLDRDRLPDPGRSRPALAVAPVAPRDELEHKLAAIWREALDLEALGVDDNFFDLGGDSLAAVRVISRVQRELNAPVGLAALFDAPTVADLAASLRGHRRSGTSAPMEEGVL